MIDLYGLSSSSSSTSRATSPQNNINHGSDSFDLYMRSNHSDTSSCTQIQRGVEEEKGGGGGGGGVSALAALGTAVRKYSPAACIGKTDQSFGVEEQLMEIGAPTDVRHVAHVTFDSFDGFLGLPAEFEPQVSRRPPSASTRVFGVSTESMQLSIDPRGNCVPTILLMMQRRLYQQGGLQSEGIFRINPGNGQEEHVREQLNNGVIPDNIDVHCFASLIKAWFRELPNGILDSLAPEQVMEAQSEEEWFRLVKLLPPIEGALLDWAVNLMADVAQFEHHSKMNARKVAMVFAPNMTQMSDPLTALLFAVQVMNFLKTLIEKALREREDCLVEAGPMLPPEPSNKDGHHCTFRPITLEEADEKNKDVKVNEYKERLSNSSSSYLDSRPDNRICDFLNSVENVNPADVKYDEVGRVGNNSVETGKAQPRRRRDKTREQHSSNRTDVKRKESRKHRNSRLVDDGGENAETKKKEPNVNSHSERQKHGGETLENSIFG